MNMNLVDQMMKYFTQNDLYIIRFLIQECSRNQLFCCEDFKMVGINHRG